MNTNIIKKIIISVLLCLAFIFIVSCGAEPSDASDADANAPDTAENGNDGDAEPVADESAKNEDIFGAITEIVGNLLTIDLAAMPESGIPVPQDRKIPEFDFENMPEGGVVTMPDGSEVRFSRGDGSEGAVTVGDGPLDGAMPEGAQFFSSDSNGAMPQRIGEGAIVDGENFVRGEGMALGGRGGSMSVMLEYKGEETEFIIPIGMPIYVVTKDDDGNYVETEIELTDIKAGNVINVVYREDGKTIDKILVSQVTALKQSEIPEVFNRTGNNDANADNDSTDGD